MEINKISYEMQLHHNSNTSSEYIYLHRVLFYHNIRVGISEQKFI